MRQRAHADALTTRQNTNHISLVVNEKEGITGSAWGSEKRNKKESIHLDFFCVLNLEII